MRLGPWTISRSAEAPEPRPVRPRAVNMEPLTVVQCAACAHFGMPLRAMVGPSRRADIVHARHIAMWVARQTTSASLPQIGRAFGGRDHTTVLYAVRKVERLRAFPVVAAEIESVMAEVDGALWPTGDAVLGGAA